MTMSSETVCGGVASSRRGLLALIWSFVTIAAILSFILAFVFTMKADNLQYDNYSYDESEEEKNEEERDVEVAVTTRAMGFASLWTAVLACLMGIFGTVILGWQSPGGQYYTCCASNVHRTTPLALGSFIGALLMLANVTLVCSILFGEFQIRDYYEGEDRNQNEDRNVQQDTAVERSSKAFSVLCMFLTVLYAGFAALTYIFSQSILEEFGYNERDDPLNAASPKSSLGYIGERFDMRTSNHDTFVAPQPNSMD